MKKYLFSVLVSFIGIIFILNIITPSGDVLYHEKRMMPDQSTLNYRNIITGKFTNDFEDYVQDSFIFRDQFRFFKSFLEFKVFRKKENNNTYVYNDYIIDKNYPTQINNIEYSANKLNEIINILKPNIRIRYSIIPSKSIYVSGNYLKSDYDLIVETFSNNIDSKARKINVTDIFTLDNYYKTDYHWNYLGVYKFYKIVLDSDSEVLFNVIETRFYGSNYGKLMKKSSPDSIVTYSHKDFKEMTIYYYQGNNYHKKGLVFYDSELDNIYSYNYYLGGNKPLSVITNPHSNNEKSLVVFKDSYANSLGPLLALDYKNVYMFDLKQCDIDFVKKFLPEEDYEVLILYSSLLLNRGEVIK